MCIKDDCAVAICLGGCSQGARSGVALGFLGFTYYPMHGISAVLLGHHGGCSHDGVLSGVALGCHSKCAVIRPNTDPTDGGPTRRRPDHNSTRRRPDPTRFDSTPTRPTEARPNPTTTRRGDDPTTHTHTHTLPHTPTHTPRTPTHTHPHTHR